MNLLQAAESIIRSRMDEYGFIMNSCLHDQKTENLDNFLKALDNFLSDIVFKYALNAISPNLNGISDSSTDSSIVCINFIIRSKLLKRLPEDLAVQSTCWLQYEICDPILKFFNFKIFFLSFTN